MEGHGFADIPNIHCNMMLLQGIIENGFQDWFWQWHNCLMKCIASQGEYSEGTAVTSKQEI
jgi:hypothetical protein